MTDTVLDMYEYGVDTPGVRPFRSCVRGAGPHLPLAERAAHGHLHGTEGSRGRCGGPRYIARASGGVKEM